MADITMCSNKECKLKDKCVRFLAIPYRQYQSYIPDPKEACEKKEYELFVDVNK